MTPLRTRLLIAMASAAISALALEGAYSLWTGSSLLHRRERARSGGLALTDEERRAAGRFTEGFFARELDPHVSIRMKAALRDDVLGAAFRTDVHGQRFRPGPPPEPGARRIVILGDSVAFGVGSRDEETLAHRLEETLAASLAPGNPRPFVQTVACPGWNHRNEIRYLLNHFDRLAPEIVILLPYHNDFDDSHVVLETGHVDALQGDPVRGPFAPSIATVVWQEFLLGYHDRFSAGWLEHVRAAGGPSTIVPVVVSGITPESERRWQELFDGLAEMQRRMQARGGHLVVVHMFLDDFTRLYVDRVARALPELPQLVLFRDFAKADQLPNDPHPNARTFDAIARRLAEHVIEKAWVPGAGARPLPAEDSRFADRRVQLDLEENARFIADLTARRAGMIGPRIDLSDGFAFHQIYGGIDVDGMMGRNALVALRNDANSTRLALTIERLPRSSLVYPLELRVTFDGTQAASIAIEAPSSDAEPTTTLTVSLPDAMLDRELLDVGLHASNWIARRHEGLTRLESFRLLRIEMR